MHQRWLVQFDIILTKSLEDWVDADSPEEAVEAAEALAANLEEDMSCIPDVVDVSVGVLKVTKEEE